MPPSKGVPIALGDGTKKRTLRYDWGAMEKVEGALGAGGLIDIQRRLEQASMRTISTLVWAGLLHAEPDLTREEVVKKLQTRRLGDITEAISGALTAALGSEEDEAKGGAGGKAEAATD